MTYLLSYQSVKKNKKLVKTEISNYQTTNGNWTNIEGSQITYTHAVGSTNIIYQFTTAYGYEDSDNGLELRLQKADLDTSNPPNLINISDVVSNNDNYHIGYGSVVTNSYSMFSSIINPLFVINISDANITGEKTFVLQCRSFNGSSSYDSVINCTKFSNAYLKYNPYVTCYSM